MLDDYDAKFMDKNFSTFTLLSPNLVSVFVGPAGRQSSIVVDKGATNRRIGVLQCILPGGGVFPLRRNHGQDLASA
jgi:hypothetical protein